MDNFHLSGHPRVEALAWVTHWNWAGKAGHEVAFALRARQAIAIAFAFCSFISNASLRVVNLIALTWKNATFSDRVILRYGKHYRGKKKTENSHLEKDP